MVEEEDMSSLAELLMKRELYKPTKPIYDDGCSPETEIPFHLLSGESPCYIGLYKGGSHFVVLTNYRFFATCDSGFFSIPVGVVEGVETQYSCDLILLCKDGRNIRLLLDNNTQCKRWYDRVIEAIKLPLNFTDTFAFIHYAYSIDSPSNTAARLTTQRGEGNVAMATAMLTSEYRRMGLDLAGTWRITECNTKYGLCSSYPKLFVVPLSVTDFDLHEVAKFRSLGRVPAVVWRHKDNGCVIGRSSQPMVGVLGWRCQEDEKLLLALSESSISHITNAPSVEVMSRGEDTDVTNGYSSHIPSLLVLDLRSYAAALGNRAKGGGCEHQDYYSNCEIRYKGLPNIHSVRRSFLTLRSLLMNDDYIRFLSNLEGTQWLYNISQLLQTAVEVAVAIHDQARPVLVHCSDGWDRTTQIVTLAELILDPYYRTIEGFQVLIEREWLSFGHKFDDRNNVDGEQSPVFLQWLDCVYQITNQYPTSFEFNGNFLIKLCQHCYSQLYGTFLANCEQVREKESVSTQTMSVWSLLHSQNKEIINVLYKRDDPINKGVLYPDPFIQRLQLWRELYMGSPLISYSTFSSFTLSASYVNSFVTPTNQTEQSNPFSNGHSPQLQNNLSNENKIEQVSNKDSLTLEKDTVLTTPLSSNSTEQKLNGLLADNEEGGAEEPPTLNSSHLWPSNENIDIDESFRVVSEDSQSSLTTHIIHSNSKDISTPTQSNHSSLGVWSTPTNHYDRTLSYSMFSECDSRLRHLGPDGLGQYIDPVQQRMIEIKDTLEKRVQHLESKVRKLTMSLKNRQDSGGSVGGASGEECLPLSLIISDDEEKPSSPVNGWTYVEVSDSQGVKWVPDHAVSHCPLCGDQFWMGKRKHHCRSCGGVFCWQCSNYLCPVPHEQLFDNQRVCKTCFDRLGGYNSSTSH